MKKYYWSSDDPCFLFISGGSKDSAKIVYNPYGTIDLVPANEKEIPIDEFTDFSDKDYEIGPLNKSNIKHELSFSTYQGPVQHGCTCGAVFTSGNSFKKHIARQYSTSQDPSS